MAWTTEAGWPGRVWVSGNGKRKTYYIRQYRAGKRWDVSTKCSTRRGAEKELVRFEDDPEGYRPAGSGEQLVLDAALIERYAAWCRTGTESTDARWLEAKKRYLTWWAAQLKGRALSGGVTLTRILDCLEGQPSRKDRIVSIKHLYAWLRQTDQIAASDDPTLDALPVPQAKKAQDARGSKVIPEADYRAVLPLLESEVADACRVMAGTGCHLSEVIRLVKTGAVEIPVAPPPSVATGAQAPAPPAVLTFRHKGGHDHRVQVSPTVAEAALRLKASGWAPARETFYRSIREACTKAGVERWTPGRFRHTFATRAVAAGVAPSAVALALGHTSPATTLAWYATTAVAPRVDGGYED